MYKYANIKRKFRAKLQQISRLTKFLLSYKAFLCYFAIYLGFFKNNCNYFHGNCIKIYIIMNDLLLQNVLK